MLFKKVEWTRRDYGKPSSVTVILVSGSWDSTVIMAIISQQTLKPRQWYFLFWDLFICVIIILKAQPQSIQFVFFFFNLIIVKVKIDFITIYLSNV